MNLLFILFLFLNASHLTLSVKEPKDGKIRPTFDEIYGKGWDENDHQNIKVETSPLNSEENALNEQADHDDNIDQDVEAYNSDSTDQNLTQEDSDRIEQSGDETAERINNENKFSEKEKRKIISKFHAMKEKYTKKGKFTKKERANIECKIGNKLGVTRRKIYKWKKEFGLSRKMKINKKSFYEKKKREFIERMDKIKMSQRGEQNKLAKDLGISEKTFRCWKKEFGLPFKSQIKHSESEKLEVIRKYYKIKQINPKISESDIANILNIERTTLYRWKKQFINFVDEHSLTENRPTFAHNEDLQPFCKIGNKLGVNRRKIYKWKKEFGLSRKTKRNKNIFYEKKKREFIKRMDKIKMSQFGEQNKLMKDLGISYETFRCWKKEFGLPFNSQQHSDSEKLELMRKYYKIKQIYPKISESDIAIILNIERKTLYRWKKQFVNSVDEHSLSENRPTFSDNDTSEHPPMASSDDNLWAWNLAKKKKNRKNRSEILREQII